MRAAPCWSRWWLTMSPRRRASWWPTGSKLSQCAFCSPMPIRRMRRPRLKSSERSRPIFMFLFRTRSIQNGASMSVRRRGSQTPTSGRRCRDTCTMWSSCRCSGFRARALMMKSDGGAGSAAMLASTPIRTVMSGPVAGVIGSRYLGDVKGIDKLISFDVGGTSSDMAVIPGLPLFKSEFAVARHPMRSHTVDIETIGAGGGSIASIAVGGVLKVGPQSAGAFPGPACYERDGAEPTLTDALVTLGHLNPTVLLDGEMPISRTKAHDAVRTRIAEPLDISPVKAAWGILTVLATNVMVA